MPYSTDESMDGTDGEPAYTGSWDFSFSEVLRGALGGRRQTNRVIHRYAEQFEQAARLLDAERDDAYVEIYDPVQKIEQRTDTPDSLWDELIDDVDVEEVELAYESDDGSMTFSYDRSLDQPFHVEATDEAAKDELEELYDIRMKREWKPSGLLGLLD